MPFSKILISIQAKQINRVSISIGTNRVQESVLFMNVNVGGLKSYLFYVRKMMKVVSRP